MPDPGAGRASPWRFAVARGPDGHRRSPGGRGTRISRVDGNRRRRPSGHSGSRLLHTRGDVELIVPDPAITLDATVTITPEVVFKELRGEAVLLDLASGIYFGLDETSTRLWQLLMSHGSLRRTF